jgi:hypothetical protein
MDINEPIKTGYATYLDYNSKRLSSTGAERKVIASKEASTSAGPAKEMAYHVIPFLYNYGTDTNKQVNDFLIELSEVESPFGIQPKVNAGGREEFRITVKYDLTNPENVKTVKVLDGLYMDLANILFQFKGDVGMPKFKASSPDDVEGAGLWPIVFRPMDKSTGEVLQGRAPLSFFKLFSRGRAPCVEQTLFKAPNGDTIPWSLLKGVELKFVPLIHVKRFFIGSVKLIQIDLISAFVTDIKSRGSESKQMPSILRMTSERPELVDKVSSQLAKLTADRQEQLCGASHTFESEKNDDEISDDNIPTFSGITPIKTIGSLPNIQGLSMSDFVSNAPSRETPQLSFS